MRLAHPTLLRQIRVFCVAARTLSFKAAAAQMYLTPSAVSHQVRELEEHLGVKLFERRTRALELTAEGRQLLEECEPLLVSVEDAVIRLSRRRQRRVLRLVLPPFFASELFIPNLAGFYAAQPEIDIQMTTTDPRPTEHPPDADVSVLLVDVPPPHLVVEELFPLRLVPACAPSVAARAGALAARVFDEYSLIVQRTRREEGERWAAANGIVLPARRKLIELDNMYAVVRAAEQGLGIALVPQIAARAWFTSGSLQRFAGQELETGERYCLAHRVEDARRPDVAAFHDWAITTLRAP
ncbi:MAG: LysR family transcriptional regulator [Steroidobacteraceae bacterium]|jgi:LysR family glycine cleavage system transcriptional activator|nr:LysR family transcriptional regulator [Steroidobacteraceae bacterium]